MEIPDHLVVVETDTHLYLINPYTYVVVDDDGVHYPYLEDNEDEV